MRTLIRAVAALAAAGLTLAPTAASALPTPSPGATTVTTAGTSFLTATAIAPGQPVEVDAVSGDHLYWSFRAEAGQTHTVGTTVSLPKGRTGRSTWTIDVFDGLRRRQACTAGAQTSTVDATLAHVGVNCTLRRVRPWAEPWSGDPLPGTYYVRLAVTDLPEADLGLPIRVILMGELNSEAGVSGDDGKLKAPLVPNTRAGAVLTAEPTPELVAEKETSLTDWLPEPGSRWVWTTAGGVLAAVAGVVGFALTRRHRRP
ncbi:peptidase [Micromonospora sp. NPDC048999]|uniref:peptidase n=1 Tax=Micromonospora sp. NPDC048999 TaxID=3155391 RepID=UPI0033DFE136